MMSAPRTAFIADAGPHPAQTAAAEEFGDPEAGEITIESNDRPTPTDPGAVALVVDLLTVLAERQTDNDGVTWIGLEHVRNLSQSSATEFHALKTMLAGRLNRAGESHTIRFASEPEAPVQYEMLGSAYLITRQGLDQWELYLRLAPSGADWTLWQSQQPIRLLRHTRTGQNLFMPMVAPAQ